MEFDRKGMYNADSVPIKVARRRSFVIMRPDSSTPSKFVVLYPGPRMSYAVPALLAREGMLERFYTDVHASSGPLSLLRRFPPRWLPAAIARLAGRQLPPELAGRVSSVPFTALAERVACALRDAGLPLPVPSAEARMRERVRRDRFCGAGALYTMTNADLDLVREAKSRGMKVVHEQIINPHVGRILREERAAFPGIEPQDSEHEIESGIACDEEQWRLSDIVLVPSEFVKNEILEHGISERKIGLVPYGVREQWLTSEPSPVRGRVLFVGSVGLRKGVHYLAAASRILARRGVAHETRVVGPYAPGLPSRTPFQGLQYVGQVPRTLVRAEFLSADVFVFPTLADSFALTHLEALACGVPVITTPNCGSVVRDGVDGFIVPIRDPDALAARVEQLLEDRALRERMSRNARARAAEFTWARYGERLLSTIRSVF